MPFYVEMFVLPSLLSLTKCDISVTSIQSEASLIAVAENR